MAQQITSDMIADTRIQLEQHPLYAAITNIEDLRCFMQHHIYSVWDFMSMIKYLQSIIAPTVYPWTPQGDASVRRFINELVLEEETDETHIAGEHSSHFELYQRAMAEIGADTQPSMHFLALVREQGIEQALRSTHVPEPSRNFTRYTFKLIQENNPHQVAAALALGREHVIPFIFRSILARIGVSEKEAPIFHWYLKRHVHLDEDFHAPLSLRLLNGLCADDSTKVEEAVQAAKMAVTKRVEFWDQVLIALQRTKVQATV